MKRLILYSFFLIKALPTFSQPCLLDYSLSKDTTICLNNILKLQLNKNCTDPYNSPTWELLIPGSSYQGTQTNFNPSGYDSYTGIWYSVLRGGSVNQVYSFDLVNKIVTSITQSGGPGELFNYSYDRTNKRLIACRVGRDYVYTLPISGGTWQYFGSGGFDAESYGSLSYWNPVTNHFGFFGGYGFYTVKNWVWENDGTNWINTYVNNNGCNPPKRISRSIAFNQNGDKMYIFSGLGSCSGDQFAGSCSLGSPWPTDVGVYCWLRDLWELDLKTFQFTNILPVNSQSINREGAIAYDYINNTFYNIGGRAPTATYNVYTPYTMNVSRFRKGIDQGFIDITINGTPPPADKDGNAVYDPIRRRILYARTDGIWALNLGGKCNWSYSWSTGEITNSISVNPIQQTKYFVSINDGFTICKDSVTVSVSDIGNFKPFPDTIFVNSKSTILDAGAGFSTYVWNTGENSQIITVNQDGNYNVVVSNVEGCSATSKVYVQFQKEFKIPNIFSPNGDGIHDRWEIQNLSNNPGCSVDIYNRYGQLIFHSIGYSNPWDGTVHGSRVPLGTYYYIIDMKNGKNKFSGYLDIIR